MAALLLLLLLALLCAGRVDGQSVPSVPLRNAAVPGTMMPVLGIGTGAYGSEWSNQSSVASSIRSFLLLGGRRIDTSLSYLDQPGIGQGMQLSGVPRSEIFVTSKVGPYMALGYNESLAQFAQILSTLQTDYVDLLLIHWPGPVGNSTDPACVGPAATPRLCRQSTWRAMQDIFKRGQARAIGVSNFETNHLADIYDMGELLPSVNQVEFHPYWHNQTLLEACKKANIVFNGYSPLGAPDRSPVCCKYNLLQDPVIGKIAQDHSATPAQVILAWEWQQGVVVNPRTNSTIHMAENLSFFKVHLSDSEMEQIAALTVGAGQVPNICPDPSIYP